MSDPIVIVSAARTAMGSFQGGFSSLTAANLGAEAIKAAVARAGLDANLIEEVRAELSQKGYDLQPWSMPK